MTKASKKGKGAPRTVRNEIREYLARLGFAESTARSRPLGRNGSFDVVGYDTYEEGSRQPYLVVFIDEQFSVPNLFLDLPYPEVKSKYVAFTDGTHWSWYRSTSDASNLIPLDEPPPPPLLPPGQRWLEPIRDKKDFKNTLRAMNIALRDSRGGGIVERFDVIGKALFTKVFDEREVKEGKKDQCEFHIAKGESVASLCKRVGAIWRRACARHEGLYRGRTPELTEDQPALYRIVQVLESISLLQTRVDIKGLAVPQPLFEAERSVLRL